MKIISRFLFRFRKFSRKKMEEKSLDVKHDKSSPFKIEDEDC